MPYNQRQGVWPQPWPTRLVTQPKAGNASSPTWLDEGAHCCHPINSLCSSPIPWPTRQECCHFNNAFCHPKGAPALEGKGGRRGTSVAAALLLQEQRGKTKLVESGDHALGSHCSQATPSTKLYLGSSWNKSFHSPPGGKARGGQRAQGCFAVSSRLLPKASLLCLGL